MGTLNYVQEEMNFTPQEPPVAPAAPPARALDEDTPLSKMTRGSPVRVREVFEAGDRLTEGLEERGKEFEINWRASKVDVRRLPSVKGVDRREESLYWLFSAALLVYLLWKSLAVDAFL
jgi:hypothetical protein